MQFEFQNDNDRNKIRDIDIALGGSGVVVLRHGPAAPQHTTASPKRTCPEKHLRPGPEVPALFQKTNRPLVDF